MKSILNCVLFSVLLTPFYLMSQETNTQQNYILLLTGQGSPTLTIGEYSLLEEVGEAFEKMKEAALADGIEIKVVSAYRSFSHQVSIWNRKFKKNEKDGLALEQNIGKIMQFSTIPGTSRHHWGTEIDIIMAKPHVEGDVLLEHLFENNGPYSSLKNWMDECATSYGFALVYTANKNRSGFEYEPWHYTYYPKSIGMLKGFISLDLKEILDDKMILGKECFSEQFIEQYTQKYVLGVADVLKK